jgi:hypothetical protein
MIGGNVSLLIREVRGIQEYVPAKSRGREIGPDRRRSTNVQNQPTNQSIPALDIAIGPENFTAFVIGCTYTIVHTTQHVSLVKLA